MEHANLRAHYGHRKGQTEPKLQNEQHEAEGSELSSKSVDCAKFRGGTASSLGKKIDTPKTLSLVNAKGSGKGGLPD